MKCLIIAAVAYASLTATATAAPSADVVAACRSTIEEVFSDGGDYTARDFCDDVTGGQSLDELENTKVSLQVSRDIRGECGAEDMVRSVCGGITGPTGTAAPAAPSADVVAACRSTIEEVFSDGGDYTARDFCDDVTGGQSLDDLENTKVSLQVSRDIRDECGAEDMVRSVCGGITGTAAASG